MFWILTREGRWARRMSHAQWDAAYHRSGIQFHGAGLAKAQLRIEQLQRDRVNVDYPVRGVTP